MLIWAPKGQQPEIATHTPYGKVNLTGFVCPANGDIFINQMEKGDSGNFKEQLAFLAEKYQGAKCKVAQNKNSYGVARKEPKYRIKIPAQICTKDKSNGTALVVPKAKKDKK